MNFVYDVQHCQRPCKSVVYVTFVNRYNLLKNVCYLPTFIENISL